MGFYVEVKWSDEVERYVTLLPENQEYLPNHADDEEADEDCHPKARTKTNGSSCLGFRLRVSREDADESAPRMPAPKQVERASPIDGGKFREVDTLPRLLDATGARRVRGDFPCCRIHPLTISAEWTSFSTKSRYHFAEVARDWIVK